jgi:hypothetical protein
MNGAGRDAAAARCAASRRSEQPPSVWSCCSSAIRWQAAPGLGSPLPHSALRHHSALYSARAATGASRTAASSTLSALNRILTTLTRTRTTLREHSAHYCHIETALPPCCTHIKSPVLAYGIQTRQLSNYTPSSHLLHPELQARKPLTVLWNENGASLYRTTSRALFSTTDLAPQS